MILKCLLFLQTFGLIYTKKNPFQMLHENSIAEITVKLTRILHSSTSRDDENVLFSPFSIYTVMHLAQFATGGNTAKEISRVLELPISNEPRRYLTNVLTTLKTETRLSEVIPNLGFFLQNSIKLNNRFAFKTKKYYHSEIRLLDYKTNEATNYINKWVFDRTKNRIQALYTSPLPRDTVSLFVSTWYFKSNWATKFEKSNTYKGKFNTGIKEIDVDFMRETSRVPYVNNTRLQYEAIALDYQDRQYCFFIILPYTTEGITSLISKLKTDDLNELIESASNSSKPYIDYTIPRMKLNWKNDLKDTFIKLGIKQLFTIADFRKFVKSPPAINVSSVIHAAEFEATEEGTIAPMAVGTKAKFYSNPTLFHVNKPFMFFIYHPKTKTYLLTGLISRPQEE